MLILDKFLLKYERGGDQIDPPLIKNYPQKA